MVSLADIPVEVVGHSTVDSIDQHPDPAQQPPQVVSRPVSMPVFSEENMATCIQDGEGSNKRRRVETIPPHSPTVAVDNGDKSAEAEERTSNIDHLYHDHCYSNRIPYFAAHLPAEARSQYVTEERDKVGSISSASSPDYNLLPSKDFSYDEDDLTCKEVMETEEEMDQRVLADIKNRKSKTLLCKAEASEPYLDQLLQMNDTASLLNAIDDDIEKLMQEEEEFDSDFDYNAYDNNDDEYDFFPVVKQECIETDKSTKIDSNALEVRSKKTQIKSKECIKAEPKTP